MGPWRCLRLWSFVIACVLITCVLVEYQLTQDGSVRNQSSRKLDQSPTNLERSVQEQNQASSKLDQSSSKLNQSSSNLKQSSSNLNQSLSKSNQSSPEQVKKPEKSPRIYNRTNIKVVREVFPLDSRPPDSLHKGFIIENVGLCSSVLSLGYIIVVHSATDHFDRRQYMRQTWTKRNIFTDMNSQRIFLLGKTLNKGLQRKIVEENQKYGDIVQGDFIDHYRNLTLKAVMGLKWVTKNCRHADYVIKVDDDVFINIFEVKKTIFPLLTSNPMQVVCSVESHTRVLRTNKKSNAKWSVSFKYFKGEKLYPTPFCYGYATFFSTTLASELLNVAYSTPFFRLDDVYVYGILMSKIKSASWRDERHRYFKNENHALKNFPKMSDALVGTARSNRSMQLLWKLVSK